MKIERSDAQLILSNPNQIQSPGEEIANSISHGIGLVGALIGVIWGLALFGVMLKAFYKTAHPISFHLPLSADGVVARDRGEAFICQHVLNGPVLFEYGRLVLHCRCRLFRNRFSDTLWPPGLASVFYGRHHVPLFLCALVCSLTIDKFPSQFQPTTICPP